MKLSIKSIKIYHMHKSGGDATLFDIIGLKTPITWIMIATLCTFICPSGSADLVLQSCSSSLFAAEGRHVSLTVAPSGAGYSYYWTADPAIVREPGTDNWVFAFVAPDISAPTKYKIELIMGPTGAPDACKDACLADITVLPRASLVIDNVVDWNVVVPDTTKIFTICIKGPSYPTGTENGACQTTGYQGGTVIWTNLMPGLYTVVEESPGSEWTVTLKDSPATVPADGMGSASILNVIKPGNLDVTKAVDWKGVESDLTKNF